MWEHICNVKLWCRLSFLNNKKGSWYQAKVAQSMPMCSEWRQSQIQGAIPVWGYFISHSPLPNLLKKRHQPEEPPTNRQYKAPRDHNTPGTRLSSGKALPPGTTGLRRPANLTLDAETYERTPGHWISHHPRREHGNIQLLQNSDNIIQTMFYKIKKTVLLTHSLFIFLWYL